MAETRTYITIREMSEAGDKPTKARSFQGRMAHGKVYFPKRAEWLDDLVLEMSMFPVGHDDQVDALGIIGRMLDEMVGGRGSLLLWRSRITATITDPLKSTPKTTGRRSETMADPLATVQQAGWMPSYS